MYTVEELKHLMEFGHKNGVARFLASDKNVTMDFFKNEEKQKVSVVLPPMKPPAPIDPLKGTDITDELLFYSAGGE